MKSNLLKSAVVAVLAIALFIPVAMIQDLVRERQMRRNEAVAGIAEGWGKHQTLAGPYLAIPYERSWTTVTREVVEGKTRERITEHKESQTIRRPVDSVEWTVEAKIGEKARGIYKARLYSAAIRAQGAFTLPARAALEDGSSRYKWGTPRLVVGIADPNGIRAAPPLRLDGESHVFAPGTGDAPLPEGLHVPLADARLAAPQKKSFSFSLDLGGSEGFAIAPLGADTALAMNADWPHPSFQGRFLPARHEIGASGFSAAWQVSRFAGQSGGREGNCAWPCAAMNDQVAVWFVEPAGLYQRLERASKYGFLFIGLTFAAFILIELLRRLSIHPVQYALVGLALAMFFLLLTALSEHVHFAAAYSVATLACVSLVTGYLVRVLRSARIGLAFGAALTALYAMLYALLKAEDYSLLGGSLLLFALLAALMIATRRVDWYALGVARPAATT
jgi:inner membrane protein